MKYLIHPDSKYVKSIGDESKVRFFFKNVVTWRSYFIAVDETVMTGMISYNRRSDGEIHYFNVSAVSVHDDYKNQGIATKLLEMFFEYAKKHEYKIKPGFYEDDGLKYLKKKFDYFSKLYGVELI